MSYILVALLILRLGWAILPQSGYIHPDEFFQTVEVVAGDALNVSVVKTWEFTSANPLRSVVLPQLIFHPIFKLLKYADEISSFQMTGYHLVTSYRLLMAVLSLWIDFCVYKICKVIGVQCHTANILLASSYVTLTYQTHTFSNSFEILLFVTLILLILVCIRKDKYRFNTRECLDKLADETAAEENLEDDSSDLEDLDSSFNNLHKNAFNLRKRNQQVDFEMKSQKKVIFNKSEERFPSSVCSKYSEKEFKKKHVKDKYEAEKTSNLYIYTGIMALIVTLGIFNRPTFIIFAFLPLYWWAEKHPTGELYVFKRAAVFILTGIVFSVIFVAIDTAYFTDFDMTSLVRIDGWQKLLEKCVITPLNFVLYNSVAVNLAEHGYHPFYLHLLVNMPILFGPMLFYIAKHSIKNVFTFLKVIKSNETIDNEKSELKQVEDRSQNELKSDFKGMLGMFIFFPVTVLSFFPHQEARFLIPLLPLVVLGVTIFSNKLGKIFWAVFVIFNLLLSVLFGMLHQGGVIPSLIKLQTYTQKEIQENHNISISIFYSHTYMPPKHVLLDQVSNLELIDLKGSDLQHLIDEIEKKKISKSKSTKVNVSKSGKEKIFVSIPGPLVTEFKTLCNGLFRMKSVELFFPHLTFEDLPKIALINSCESFYSQMSLHLLELE